MATYNTIEAVVKEGIIYPIDPKKLPREGKLLLIVLDEKDIKPDTEKISGLLGWLKSDVDSEQWQQQIRSEWDKRL
ncbi:MAG: hypothetical protein KJ826_19000 [Proteobacteria bacterium]|nr:hypothetical protein [Pseudomonadota bacterium]